MEIEEHYKQVYYHEESIPSVLETYERASEDYWEILEQTIADFVVKNIQTKPTIIIG